MGEIRSTLDIIMEKTREEELDQARRERIRLALDRLAERDISGTAVVPNLNRDPEWTAFRRLRIEECRRELRLIP